MQFDVQFQKTNFNEVSKMIDNVNIVKAWQNSDIPHSDTIAPFISEDLVSCIEKFELHNDLKHADIAPVHRKKSKSNKTNYSSLNILCISISVSMLLLLAKYHGYGLSHTFLRLTLSYFESRTQLTKANNCFSNPSKTDYAVPQGSILGPLFLNISLIDIFYESKDSDIENYADQATPYTCAPDTETVISK